MSTTALGTVFIKTQCAPLLKENLSRIKVIFSAQLTEKTIQEQDGITNYDITAPIAEEKMVSTDFINRVQVSANLVNVGRMLYLVGRWKFINLYTKRI